MSDIKTVLYKHVPHWHKPVNVNEKQKEEQRLNTSIAVWLTKHVGTMVTAYIFTGIGIGSLVGVFTNNTFLALLFGSISSYLLQLVLLPVIMTGQNVLSRHTELLAEEQFNTTQKSYHDIEQIMNHLDSQDAAILDIASKVEQMEKIETTEVLKMADMLTEILEIVKRPPVAALTSAIDYEPTVQSKSAADKKGKAKA